MLLRFIRTTVELDTKKIDNQVLLRLSKNIELPIDSGDREDYRLNHSFRNSPSQIIDSLLSKSS